MALSAQYTPQFTIKEDPWTVKYAATADLRPGDLVRLANGLVGYVNGVQPIDYIDATAANKVMVTVSVSGAGDVAKASGTVFADGAAVYFDTASGLAVTAQPAAGYYLGTARGAGASGVLSVRVLLNGPQIIMGADGQLTLRNRLSLKATTAPVAAAGSTVADAAALDASNTVHITSDGAAKGVKLPTGVTGDFKFVLNNSATAAKLYAAAGGTTNGQAADAAVVIAASKGVLCFCTAADTWIVFDLAAKAANA